MKLHIDLPLVVKRAVQPHITAWDPRIGGADQCIEVMPPVRRAYLTSETAEDPPKARRMWLRWSKDVDPKTGARFWRVEPTDEGSKTVIRNLEMELTHHFDDPFEVA